MFAENRDIKTDEDKENQVTKNPKCHEFTDHATLYQTGRYSKRGEDSGNQRKDRDNNQVRHDVPETDPRAHHRDLLGVAGISTQKGNESHCREHAAEKRPEYTTKCAHLNPFPTINVRVLTRIASKYIMLW